MTILIQVPRRLPKALEAVATGDPQLIQRLKIASERASAHHVFDRWEVSSSKEMQRFLDICLSLDPNKHDDMSVKNTMRVAKQKENSELFTKKAKVGWPCPSSPALP